MKLYRSITAIINYKTIIVTILSLVSTYFCEKLNFIADMPLTLMGTAIVFPVVFTISSAYKRREEALASYSTIKSSALSIFMAAKNWVQNNRYPYVRTLEVLLLKQITLVTRFLSPNCAKVKDDLEKEFYKTCDEVSNVIGKIRLDGNLSSEITRMDNYLNRSMIEFDKLRNVLVYRTPGSVRSYAHFFIYTFPILYAPYFAKFVSDGFPWMGFLVAVLCSFVFVSLANIQDHLENPFDSVGEDDLSFDPREFENILIAVKENKSKEEDIMMV
jgi:predicted membrane chloride channel (bestrophin family)